MGGCETVILKDNVIELFHCITSTGSVTGNTRAGTKEIKVKSLPLLLSLPYLLQTR